MVRSFNFLNFIFLVIIFGCGDSESESSDDIVIPEETIHHIIDTYTEGETGVRNLKRCLEIVYTKLNLYRLLNMHVK